jgi:aspartyl protease family protein
MLGWLIAALLALVAAFLFFSGDTSDRDSGRIVHVAVLGGLALLYLFFNVQDYRGRGWQGLKHAATWALVFMALLTGYSYRGELQAVANRVAGEVLPPGHVMSVETSNTGERAVRIRGDGAGHFSAQGAVNDVAISLLIDTGASTVVLKAADAERAGIDLSGLNFSVAVQTANGTAYAAPVRLRSVGVGPIVFDGVEALVAKPGSLNESLLGMSFLRRLRSYEVVGDFITLRG